MAYAIRPFSHTDAPQLAALTLASIRVIGSRSYDPAQIAAWAARCPTAERLRERARSGAHIVIAADADDARVAYALLGPDGHLDMLYCHPDHTRRGLADELLAASEMAARAQDNERLYSEVSELARRAFERAGYVVLHRRDFKIEHGGKAVPIHNYAMEKPLK